MKKKSRGIVTAALAAGVMILAAGCTKKDTETSAAVESTVAVEEETKAEGTEAAEKDTQGSEKEGKEQKVSVMTGTVLDAAMNSIVIQNEEYPDGIIFSREDSDAVFSEGLTIDMNVTLFYAGKADGTDTTKASVILVRESRDSDSALTAGMAAGTITELSDTEITVEREDKTLVTAKLGQEIDASGVKAKKGDKISLLYSCSDGKEKEKTAEMILER